MTAIAPQNLVCPRCKQLIHKGDPVRFETSYAGSRPSGLRIRGGGGKRSRLRIHAYDCNGLDALKARAAASIQRYAELKARKEVK